ncbi:MAG: rRNA maturation RNase YbeY [Muribaculaceae bacterium]|nr:rRNA maturation RNase YbeY [Roseburia sp.]MCM1430962.1 rRNA maturation RNase YbeY [Muribaculaceae bacterium]MCM1494107.1 rRNA maturation RNase YbeY [Muribaculaceae bacterium]
MSFYLETECEPCFDFPYEELAREVVCFCISHEGFPCGAEVNLTLTDNAGIQRINREFRQLDRPTDVLSFPMLAYDAPGDFSFLKRKEEGDFNPDTGEALLGDIVISVEKVKEQALSYNHSERREFAFLIVHSMLHLFGYDHMTEAEAAVMEEKQRRLLSAMNITRESKKN